MTDRRAAVSAAEKGAVSCSDRARLLRSWTEKWPGHPDAAESKHRFPYRWVRFDSLPESKRYPETDAEYEVLLSRHHAVLRELAGQRDAADEALIVSMSASSSPRPTRRGSAVASAAPHAKHWSSFAVDESGPETYWQHAYLSRLPLDPHRLDPLLRAVADGVAWGIIIARTTSTGSTIRTTVERTSSHRPRGSKTNSPQHIGTGSRHTLRGCDRRVGRGGRPRTPGLPHARAARTCQITSDSHPLSPQPLGGPPNLM